MNDRHSETIKIYARIRPLRSNKNIKNLSNSSTPSFSLTSPQGPSTVNHNDRLTIHDQKDSKEYINNQKEHHEFFFNKVFDMEASQEEVFDQVAKDVILNALDGYNGTIFAYGQVKESILFIETLDWIRYLCAI